jgi:tRNA U34 5-methylaminomethyl-2-thiouridine-forming methyltransferase MnmC
LFYSNTIPVMQQFHREPELTADGSYTLYIPEIDEHYHSTNGAVVEALHVYLREGLGHWLELHPEAKAVRVLEVGFGTGLNAFLTLLRSEELAVSVSYTTLELYPLAPEQVASLRYPEAAGAGARQHDFAALHAAPWGVAAELTPTFTLEKRRLDLTQESLCGEFDVVFFDAFAPDKQPEMWTEAVMRKVASVLPAGAVLTTYCAKGAVRRGWRDVGFTMERIPGPPGKREMIRGTRN